MCGVTSVTWLIGDRGLRAFGGAELSPDFSARARAEAIGKIIFEIPVIDVERGHRHAGHALEAHASQSLQRRPVHGRKFLQDDQRTVQSARQIRQRLAQRFNGRDIAVKMSFSCGTSHHQSQRVHEARPKVTYARDEFFDNSAQACEEVLVDQKERLNGSNFVVVFDNQIAVAESVFHRIFEQLVVAVVFSFVGERGLPVRRAGNLVP